MAQVSDSWTGGFIRLTRVISDNTDYYDWIRAAAIFNVMSTPAIFKQEGMPDIAMKLTTVTAGYQGVMFEMTVREPPDVILALVEAILTSGKIAATEEAN
jgi:hypothetical protein